MKKIFIFVACASGLLYAEETYTHKITLSFTVEVSPASSEQWQEIKAHFDPLLKSAQENNRKELMANLEEAFYGIPQYCQEHNVHGTTGLSLSIEAPDKE